jgi:hypothetical protein
MSSRRRTANKNLANNLAEVQRRLRTLERRPVRSKLGSRSVTGTAIGPNSVDATQVSFGINIVAQVDPVSGDPVPILNPQDGQQVFDPYSGATYTYSDEHSTYVESTSTDYVAQSIATSAKDAATTAQRTADGKNAVYTQDEPPTGDIYSIDDLWFDTNDGNKLYRWTGTVWVSAQDTAIKAASDAAAAAAEAARLGTEAAAKAQQSADGKNKIYRQTTEPSGGTYADGDTWFDTDGDNAIYRYSANTATSTVSNKALTLNVATLTTSAAHSFTPGESITVTGVDTTFNGTYTVIAVPTTTTLTYAKTAANVTAIAASGTITNTVGWKALTLGNNAITSISATKISTGTLAAGVVYAGSLNANQISTGTIASNIVYAGTVNANQINAGTLNVGVVYAGTINVNQLNAGTLAANVIYSGTINTSQINAGTITAAVSLTSATITGGTVRTAATGPRVEINSTDSTRINFFGSATTQGVITVNDYRMFMYAPGSAIGNGAVLSLYGDEAPSTPGGAFITAGPTLGLTFAMSSTTISLNQGTYGLRVSAGGVAVDGAAPEANYMLRGTRISSNTNAATSGATSGVTDGFIVLIREV